MPKLWGQPNIPDYAMRISYDGNGRQEYVGFAFPNTKTSDEGWTIYKMKYDGDGRMITRSYADGRAELGKIWDKKSDYDYLDI